MRKQKTVQILSVKLIVSLIVVTLSGCSIFNPIVVQNDIVYNTKRYELKSIYRDLNIGTPLLYLVKTIIKEVKPDKETTIKVYDLIVLSNTSFRLDEKAFILLDNNAYPLTIETTEFEDQKSITTEKKEILTRDSTTVSVATGYTVDQRKITKISYKLNTELINKISNANQLMFRYYAGPSMITIKFNNFELKTFKKLVNM